MDQPSLIAWAEQLLEPLATLEMLAEADVAMENRIIYMNQAARETMARHHHDLNAELRGADVRSAFSRSIHQFHKDPERIRAVLRGIAEGEEVVHVAEMAIGPVWFHLIFAPVKDANGVLIAFHASWREISADKAVAAAAQRIEENSGSLQNVTRQGRDSLNAAVQRMGRAAQVVEESAQAIGDLRRQAESIGGIVRSIQEIAAQTNLLALNAAIEAARAGEHGRGFAVVADEVRNLAKRAQDATVDVETHMNEVAKLTHHLANVGGKTQEEMRAADAAVKETVGQLSEVARVGGELAGLIEKMQGAVQ